MTTNSGFQGRLIATGWTVRIVNDIISPHLKLKTFNDKKSFFFQSTALPLSPTLTVDIGKQLWLTQIPFSLLVFHPHNNF